MIRLQFVQGTDLGAQLIQWWGGGPRFSHVDSVLPDGRLLGARHDVVVGAPAGVQIREASYVGQEKVLRLDLGVDDPAANAYYEFVRSQIGKPYDKQGILAFVLGRDWRDPDSWFCSELVAAGLEKCGYFEFALASPSNKITPPDLILILSALLPVRLDG